MMTKDEGRFLVNLKRFGLISSNDSSVRIWVVTDLALLKKVLADRTGKFEGNSWRDNSIWHMTRSLMMGQRGMRDRTRMDRNRWWRCLALFTYFWMYYNMKVNIQSIHDIENAMNQVQCKILWSSPKGENLRLHVNRTWLQVSAIASWFINVVIVTNIMCRIKTHPWIIQAMSCEKWGGIGDIKWQTLLFKQGS